MDVEIVFGAISPPIREQLHSQGLMADPANVFQWQEDADAITRLYVRGYYAEGMARKHRQKLLKHITAIARSDEITAPPPRHGQG